MPMKQQVKHMTLRLPPDLHKQVVTRAAKERVSLHAWFLRLADAALAKAPGAAAQ